MEKEAKEWGNKEQRATLSTLRNMFPQVDIRILKGTVLESNEIDAAVEFILTEVLEQPSTGKVDERLAKELISGSSKSAVSNVQTIAATTSNKRSAEASNVKKRYPNPFDLIGDMFSIGGDPFGDENNVDPPKSETQELERPKSPAPESSPIDIPVMNARTTEEEQQQESFTYDNTLKSPYTLMAESLTESELDTLVRDQDSSRPKQFGEMTLSQLLSAHGGPSNPVLPPADAGVKNDSTYLAESLYGSVMDVAIEADNGGADVGASRLVSDDEKAVQKMISKGRDRKSVV